MPRRLTPRSSLEGLRREAKRWLKALRANDPDVQREARARLARALPDAPPEPTLRDVQHALAREHGLAGWTALRDAVEALRASVADEAMSRDDALRELLAAADRGDAGRVSALLDRHPELARARGTLPGHTGLRTALHFGVRHADVVRTLLRHGADPDARDAEATAVDGARGYTALHSAAFHGNADAVAALLRHGANPNVRDGRWCAPPAGWADHAGHAAVRDQLLEATVDAFQAIDFGRADRIPALVRREPWQRDRPFRELAACQSGDHPEPWHTPLVWAAVRGRADAVRALLEEGAAVITAPDGRPLAELARAAGHDDVAALLEESARDTHAARVRRFVKYACPDHDIRGAAAHVDALHTAERLLRRHPEVAGDSLYTAVICGDLAAVERALAERSSDRGAPAADERGGPKGWTPLLYVCFTRLTHAPTNDNAVAIARLLLDHGADPNAYFMAGSSRYTPLVGVAGEGEEDRPPHPRRDELARLLLERGAEPYDIQVVYDIHFRGDVLWFLELIHERSLRLGRAADWADPEWRMLDMGGYGSGARWHLDVALRKNDLALAGWVLAHGASPNAAPARDRRFPQRTPYEEAMARGLTEMAALLARHGATPPASAGAGSPLPAEGEEAFVAACLRLDRALAARLARAHPEYLQSPKAMRLAAERDRADVVALLLDLGVSPDVADPEEGNQRPLHVAAYADAPAVAQLLIDRGATIDPVESNHDTTPLGFAAYGARRRMIALIGRVSRDVWHLVTTGSVARLRELLAAEPALARVASAEWGTPLMWLPAEEGEALAVAELLLAHGADPSVRTPEGRTAAEIADQRGLDAVAALLRGAATSE